MISEIDINHFKELWQLPRQAEFVIKDDDTATKYWLDTIDGMYSRCFDADGNLYHFAAFTKVFKV